MFKQIRNKILLLNMGMVSAVVIVAFAVIFTSTYTRTQNDNREKLKNAIMPQLTLASGPAFRGEFQRAEPVPNGAAFATRIQPNTGLSFSAVVDSQSNLVNVNSMVDLQEETYSQAASQALAAGKETGTISLEGRTWQFIIAPIAVFVRGSASSNVTVSAVGGEFSHIRFLDVTDSHKMIRSLALMLSGLTAALLVALFFISRFFANRAIRPMEETWEKQNRFIADASHELKTPLSIINANCGVLYAGKEETVESQLKWIDSIMRAADRMTGLAGSLLSLASMEDVQLTLQNASVDLSSEASDSIAEMEAAAFEKELIIQSNMEPNIRIESDRAHIRQILSILLDNAVKYTNSGGLVTVSLTQEKRRIICAVRNSGSGIPPEDMPHLFDRFYRRDPARLSENGGYGLGLAIAQAIATQLNAALTADSVPGEYTEFRLIFER